jgi:hypothetical protein
MLTRFDSAQPRPTENRRIGRDEIEFRTVLIDHSGRPTDALLVDISPLGFMVRARHSFAANAVLKLRLPLLEDVPAHTVWSLGGRTGCQFLTELSNVDYARLLTRLRAGARNWRI